MKLRPISTRGLAHLRHFKQTLQEPILLLSWVCLGQHPSTWRFSKVVWRRGIAGATAMYHAARRELREAKSMGGRAPVSRLLMVSMVREA